MLAYEAEPPLSSGSSSGPHPRPSCDTGSDQRPGGHRKDLEGSRAWGRSRVGEEGLATHCMNLHEGPSGQNPTR